VAGEGCDVDCEDGWGCALEGWMWVYDRLELVLGGGE
jgi:hypothetical protein